MLRYLTISILLLLGRSASVERSEVPSIVRISAALVGADVDSIEAILIIEPQDPVLAGAGEHATRLEFGVPGTIEFRPEVSGQLRIQLLSDGYWAKEQVSSPQNPEDLHFRVFATAEIRFEIATSEKARLPETVEVAFSAVPSYLRPSGKEVPAATVTCAVADATAICRVPAGEVDLRIQAAGAASVYLWGLKLEPDQLYDLGKLELVSGGSLVGFVADEDERIVDNVTILLGIRSPVSPNPIIEARLKQMTRETTTNDRGFFQISGIGPGTYSVTASKAGYAPTRSERSITIRGDLEEKLRDPLILKPAASLEITLHPPQDPFGAPWQVKLFAPGTNSRRELSGTASAAGLWSRSDVDPGGYLLIVKASDGSRWLGTELAVESGEHSLFYEIPVVQVSGSVARGGSPVVGRLALILKEKGSQADFDLDEDGEFDGFLSDEGLWEVRIKDDAQKGSLLALEPIEIERKPGKSIVELNIEVPDTRIEGDVFDAQGMPVSGAKIYLLDLELAPHSETESDDQGAFVLSGLRPGEIVAFARKAGQVSENQVIKLQEKLVPPRLRLELRELMEIDGQVLSYDGHPIPGAGIVAWLDREGSPLRRIRKIATDIDGSFRLKIPRTSRIDLFVQAPGHASRLLSEQIEPQDSIIIQLATVGGTLIFDLSSLETVQETVAMLAQDGTFASLFSLARFTGQMDISDQFSGILELPNMASGEYTLCWSTQAVVRAHAGVAPKEDCQTAFLAPNSVLRFMAPGTAGVESR